jgi:tetrahydromethanopterin S-methyltransferase subunit G
VPLIEFIGKKFDQVDQRFEGMDRRLDQMATKDEVRTQQAETRRQMGVLVEAVRDDIRQVAEGLVGVDGRLGEVEHRLDRFEQKVETEFAETRAAIRFSYAQLERRILDLEGNYVALTERVERLEFRPA